MKPIYPSAILIWSVTVVPNEAGHDPVSLHVAADFVGAALRKVQRLVLAQDGWRPHKGNSRATLKRVTLAAMLAEPMIPAQAAAMALALNERDTLKRLHSLREELGAVQRSLDGPTPSEVWKALQDEVEALGAQAR